MTAPELGADAWAPLALRWSLVRAGDVVLGQAGRLWSVAAVGPVPAGIAVLTVSGAETVDAIVHPDRPVRILVPHAEREALLALREGGVGPTMIERVAGDAA